MKDRQYREVQANLEVEQDSEKQYVVVGYATTFKPYVLYESEKEGKIFESFSGDCFKGADMSDIILQFDHAGRVFARTSNNTLKVEVDEIGLRVWADLSSTTTSRELYEDIKAGLITKMSWGFRLGDYEFDKKSKTIVHKSVKKIYDVSAVSIPANQDTNINARSFVDGEIDKALKERQECERLQLKIKIELMEKE